MSNLKDLIVTVMQLFTIDNKNQSKRGCKKTQVTKQSNIPLHILNQLKSAEQEVMKLENRIDVLPREQQYIVRKIHHLCQQLIELVYVCPSSYTHIREFFNGYLQSLAEVVQEFAYLSNQQNYSEELGRKMDVCFSSLHETYRHLVGIFNQGLLLETEELYQKINQLNTLMKEDITKKGMVIFLEEGKKQHLIKR
ncbi:MAG: 5-bromo-4-chloroindolyl phosphate hydrolysis family protein [Bacillaceae bacterium]